MLNLPIIADYPQLHAHQVIRWYFPFCFSDLKQHTWNDPCSNELIILIILITNILINYLLFNLLIIELIKIQLFIIHYN